VIWRIMLAHTRPSGSIARCCVPDRQPSHANSANGRTPIVEASVQLWNAHHPCTVQHAAVEKAPCSSFVCRANSQPAICACSMSQAMVGPCLGQKRTRRRQSGGLNSSTSLGLSMASARTDAAVFDVATVGANHHEAHTAHTDAETPLAPPPGQQANANNDSDHLAPTIANEPGGCSAAGGAGGHQHRPNFDHRPSMTTSVVYSSSPEDVLMEQPPESGCRPESAERLLEPPSKLVGTADPPLARHHAGSSRVLHSATAVASGQPGHYGENISNSVRITSRQGSVDAAGRSRLAARAAASGGGTAHSVQPKVAAAAFAYPPSERSQIRESWGTLMRWSKVLTRQRTDQVWTCPDGFGAELTR
jgi:hypothetical protein